MRAFILIEVEPDDPNERPTTTFARLETVLDNCTACAALSEGMKGIVTMRLAHDEDFT